MTFKMLRCQLNSVKIFKIQAFVWLSLGFYLHFEFDIKFPSSTFRICFPILLYVFSKHIINSLID